MGGLNSGTLLYKYVRKKYSNRKDNDPSYEHSFICVSGNDCGVFIQISLYC